jgi:hypothetical protein
MMCSRRLDTVHYTSKEYSLPHHSDLKIPEMPSETTEELHQKYEPVPDPHELAGEDAGRPGSLSTDVDYEPHPEESLKVSPEHQAIIDAIMSLYSGSASEKDMQVYAEKSIYDDPWSYCDTR